MCYAQLLVLPQLQLVLVVLPQLELLVLQQLEQLQLDQTIWSSAISEMSKISKVSVSS